MQSSQNSEELSTNVASTEQADAGNNQAAPQEQKPKLRLGEALIDRGLISRDQLQVALTEQKNSKKMLGAILVDMSFITESVLGEILAESSGAAQFDPKSAMLDSDLVRKLPKEVASRHKIIPVGITNDELQLAMSDVYNVIAIDQVRRHFPRNIKVIPVFCSETDIMELIDQYYDYEVLIDGIVREIETGIREKQKFDGTQEGYVNPMVRLVNAILVDAIKAGCSDIHFEPEGSFVRIRYRVDGQMWQARSLHRDYWSAILVRVKIMSGMNIAETRAPQDGRITFTVSGRDVDFRVATQPTIHGENIVMRLLDKTKSLVPLDQIGYSEHNINILLKLIKRPEGIIVVTGPTGSGKTTTLYSVLNHINNIDVNIMTLEDPVEYQLPLIRQTSVREGIMDFSSGVKSLLRQDPDIIFVGEVRDQETAIMAVRAALTGHQVYTTLHTNDALGVIPRLMDIGVPTTLLSGALIGIVAQRLARKLCPKCKKEKIASAEDCRLMALDPKNPPKIYEAAGCTYCNQRGYKGRIAIAEIIRVDKTLDEMIVAGAAKSLMFEHAKKQGFRSMADDGVEKILAGIIDVPELAATVDLTDRM
jgi:general secretion pathway protein E/type IV pilus assembly protein PilB